VIHAIIPAAGKSSRMGRPKLALPVGNSTVLERLIQTLRAGDISSIHVVLAPNEEQLATLTARAGGRAIHLPQATPDMRATVAFGFQWLQDHAQAGAADSVLLIPADHPALTAEPLRKLKRALGEQTQPRILVPTHQGKRGHPTILPFALLQEINELPPNEGINSLLRRREGQTVLVPVDDPAVLWDLDTEEDYQRLLAHVTHADQT
jgi:molybdenum cofactor cytidylyltransferase